MRDYAGFVAGLLCVGCMPPSVKVVDTFLSASTVDDIPRVVGATWPGDQDLLRRAMEERARDPNGKLALLLPPKPTEHQVLEIQRKESSDRHVVLVKLTMKNPLPYASKRFGQELDIPKQRTQQRRFLSVREGESWGVKLDLARVKERAEFVEGVLALVSKRKLDEAEAMLSKVPPPPDEPNALRSKDRLVEDLQAEVDKWRKHFAKTSTPTEAIDRKEMPSDRRPP